MPSNIVAYEWLLNGTTHIAYETGDNHIHEMVIGQEGTWRDEFCRKLDESISSFL